MHTKNEPIKLTDEQLRLLQLNELEMLVEVDRICKKNNIQYSLDGGTLLGAIRHKGFIPWDDDADIMFTRHEYAKFFRACKKYLDTSRFFLQDYRTDPEYRWGYAKLRRKDSEFVRYGQEDERHVGGVYMDIFALDNMPDGYIEKRVYRGLNFLVRKALYSSVGRKVEKNPIKRIAYEGMYKIPKETTFKFRNTMAKIQNKKSTKYVHHYTWPYPGENCKYGTYSRFYNEFIDVEFEGLKLRAIKDYDEYLRIVYGDYMTKPPKDKQKSFLKLSKISLIEIKYEDILDRYQKENK